VSTLGWAARRDGSGVSRAEPGRVVCEVWPVAVRWSWSWWAVSSRSLSCWLSVAHLPAVTIPAGSRAYGDIRGW